MLKLRINPLVASDLKEIRDYIADDNVEYAAKTIEEIYTNIDGLPDPYSDVEMISKRKFKQLCRKISRCTTSESMVKILKNNREHLFEPEEKMLDIFSKKIELDKKLKKENVE